MIDQYYIPPQFKHFHENGTQFDKLLKPYSDVNKASFFYSTQSIEQIILRHKGPAVMIVNNDIRPLQNNLEWVKILVWQNLKNVVKRAMILGLLSAD